MKASGGTSFRFFALLSISLVFACNEFVNCSFDGEGFASSDVPTLEVNVLSPREPLSVPEAASFVAEPALLQDPPDVLLPFEDWFTIFSFCTADALRFSLQVCRFWKDMITSDYIIKKLCLLVLKDKSKFGLLLLVLKQKSRDEQEVLLQRMHVEKLVDPSVLMDLIVLLFMMDDVFPIVIELLRDRSMPMSKLLQEECWPLSVDYVLKKPEKAKVYQRLTPELLRQVLERLTHKNFHPWLTLPRIFDQLMCKAIRESPCVALQIYREFEGAVCVPAKDFPTLSCIEPLLPLFFPVPELRDDNGGFLFSAPWFYLDLARIQSSEKVMPKKMSDKILDILSLVELNEQSLELLVPHLCPSFLKGWLVDQRHSEIGKLLITQFLNISEKFNEVHKVGYGKLLVSNSLPVIKRAIASLATIQSVPFFVYRPLIVKFISIIGSCVIYDASQVLFSGIDYPQCFMEDLCVLALDLPIEVFTFLQFLEPTQRSSLLSYSTVLTDILFSLFITNGLNCAAL